MEKKYEEFGSRVNEIMIRRNMTNKQLAQMMHVSPSAISGYRTGARSPSVADLPLLAKCLGVTTDDLVGSTDPFSP